MGIDINDCSMVWMILLIFVVYPILVGLRRVVEFEFRIETKDFSSEFYMFGLFFVEHSDDEKEYVEQEFTIALYFVTLVFIFVKDKEDA